MQAVSPFYAQLFVDQGNGFTENTSEKAYIFGYETKVEFVIENFNNLKGLRIDPINTKCVLRLNSIVIFDQKNSSVDLSYTANCNYIDGDILYFDTIDPQIYLDTPSSQIVYTKIVVYYDFISIGLKGIHEFESKINEINVLRKEIDRLKKDESDSLLLNSSKKQYLDKINHYKRVMEDFKIENTGLLKDNEALRKKRIVIEFEKNKTLDLQKEAEKKVATLSSSINNLKEDLVQKTLKILKLNETTESILKEQKTLIEKNKLINKEKEELANMNTTLSKNAEDMKNLESELKSTKEQIFQLELEKEKLSNVVQTLEANINSKEITIQKLEQAKRKKDEVVAKLAETLKQFENYNTRLEAYVDDVENSLSYKLGFGSTKPARMLFDLAKGAKTNPLAARPNKLEKYKKLDTLLHIVVGEEEQSNDTPIQGNSEILLQVDDSKFVDDNNVLIKGWILSETEEHIENIELWEKKRKVANVTYGLPRQDVGDKYPKHTNSINSGFTIFKNVNDTEHYFELKINKSDGRVFHQKIKVNNFKPLINSENNIGENPIDLVKFNQNKHPEYYKDISEHKYDAHPDDIKTITYYLPQFHSFPENDEWWGKGFTEWTNVTQGLPRFTNHFQPRLPGELGFYSLRNDYIMSRQIELAKQYGVYGFCFHYYWFSGKRVLELPVNKFLERKELDFPFCVNWANENWTRRWDGADNDILLKQNYTDQDAVDFFDEVSQLFEDPRYIRIKGRPVLLVYRPTHIPNVKEWAKIWRKQAKKKGIKDPYLVCCGSFEYIDHSSIGFDASVGFPPHQIWKRYPAVEFEEMDITHKIADGNSPQLNAIDNEFDGRVYDYRTIVKASYKDPEDVEKPYFKCVMPSWDNEARKKGSGNAFHYSNPNHFRTWMRNACRSTIKNNKPEERFLFINAWNEWAEGTYLEPDRHYGYAHLQAVAETLSEFSANKINAENFPVYDLKKTAEVAVILHLYFTEMYDEFKEQLSYIEPDFDLYISLPESKQDFMETIKADFPKAHVMLFENRGRDVGPFMEIMTKILPLDYDMVLKIHTKKSTYIEDGKEWRNYVVNNLLGSRDNVNKILKDFKEDKKLGVLAPKNCWLPLKGWYVKDNLPQLYRLGNLLGIVNLVAELDNNLEEKSIKGRAPIVENVDLSKPHFPGGTMFWFRPAALAGLLDIAITQSDFPDEDGQLDATLAHAIERIVGLVSKHNGYKTKVITSKDKK